MTMRYLITLFLILTFAHSYSQNDWPIGFIEVEFDENTTFNLYNDSLTSDPVKTIQFYHDEQINSISIKNLNEHNEWLKPESLWLDYYNFILTVTQITSNSFQVVVNEEQDQRYWIKKLEIFKFMDWQEYLKQMFNIERNPSHYQPIHVLPNSNSETINYTGSDCFKIKQLNENWIEIYTPEYCQDFKDWTTEIKSGWIQWRDLNQLLINYFVTP